MWRNTRESFGSVSKFLHWVIAFLVIIMLFAGYFMGDIPNQQIKFAIYNLHKLCGITILFLMILRVVWALTNPKPVSPPGTSRFEHFLEWSGHVFLYVLILAMPLVGWMGSVAAGYLPYIGTLQLGLPIAKNPDLSKLLFEIHDILAVVIIVMVSLHVLAALYHHYIRKDNVLKRMMPSR